MKKRKDKKVAIALKYDQNDTAPAVVAKGKGHMAEKIINKGKEENVKIFEEERLAQDLINLDIGSEIPEEYYTIVAEILAFVFDLDERESKR